MADALHRPQLDSDAVGAALSDALHGRFRAGGAVVELDRGEVFTRIGVAAGALRPAPDHLGRAGCIGDAHAVAVGQAAVVTHDRVRVAVNLQHGDRRGRGAVGRIVERGAHHADHGDQAWQPLAGQPIGHKAAVGDAHGGDRSCAAVGLRFCDQRREVGGVINVGAVEVAAGLGRIPEAVAVRIERAVGQDESEAALGDELRRAHPGVVLGSAAAVAVQHQHERERLAVVVAGGQQQRGGALAADGQLLDICGGLLLVLRLALRFGLRLILRFVLRGDRLSGLLRVGALGLRGLLSGRRLLLLRLLLRAFSLRDGRRRCLLLLIVAAASEGDQQGRGQEGDDQQRAHGLSLHAPPLSAPPCAATR